LQGIHWQTAQCTVTVITQQVSVLYTATDVTSHKADYRPQSNDRSVPVRSGRQSVSLLPYVSTM